MMINGGEFDARVKRKAREALGEIRREEARRLRENVREALLRRQEVLKDGGQSGLVRDDLGEDAAQVVEHRRVDRGGLRVDLDFPKDLKGRVSVDVGHDDSSTGSDTGAAAPRSVAVTVEVTPDSTRPGDDSSRVLSVRVEVTP